MNRKLYVLPVLLVVLVGCSIAAASATASPRDEAKAALAEAKGIFGLGPVAGSSAVVGGREATIVLRDLAQGIDRLSAVDQRIAKRILARPDDPGAADSFGREAARSPICDANFCVHWAAGGKAAPVRRDANRNGIPDFAEQTLAAGAHSFAVENTSLGWPRAISDGSRGARRGIGGAGQTDIYLAKLQRGLYGYATSDPGQRSRKVSAFLVLDNDYASFRGVPVELMQVTMAHEYNHVLQFAIDTREDTWMFESTATFMEDYVYADVNDYINFLSDFVRSPSSPLAESDRFAFKLYGSAVWNHYIASLYGPGVVLNAWQLSSTVKPQSFAVAAYDRAIRDAGGPGFAPEFVDFAAATSEWNSSTAFPDPGLYPEMKRNGSLGTKPRAFRLAHTGYRLMAVKPKAGAVTLRVRTRRGVRSGVALVGRIGAATGGTVESAVKYLPDGGGGKVTLADGKRFSRITAVIANADARVKGSSRLYTRDGINYRARLGD